jgi:hypothetical protein
MKRRTSPALVAVAAAVVQVAAVAVVVAAIAAARVAAVVVVAGKRSPQVRCKGPACRAFAFVSQGKHV